MRTWAIVGAALCVWLEAGHQAEAPWDMRLEWGDSIPAGTVYTMTLEGTGVFHVERKGLPFTAQGLTTARHQGKVSVDVATNIRACAERLIRRLDFKSVQGRMVGDGGFVKVQISEGTVSFSAELTRLSSFDQGGDDSRALLTLVRGALPEKFIH